MLDRREFLTVFVAASTAAVLPGIAISVPTKPRPEIGAEFYTGDWLAANAPEDIWREAGKYRGLAFKRAEKERGIRLANYRHDVTYHRDRDAWFVMARAEVVGYA